MTSMNAQAIPGQQKVEKARPVRAAFLALLMGILLGGAAVELVARAMDRGMNFDIEMWKYARDLKRVSSNPEIGHEHRPNGKGVYMGVPVQINSMGLRDREYPLARTKGVTRILMLGDSVTFGWGVKAEDTPSKLLEKSLNAGLAKPGYEVINTGVGNYNTAMEVAYFLDRGRRYNPDIVILNYFINDAEITPKRKKSVLTEHSQAAVMFASAIDKMQRTYFGKSDWRHYYSDLYAPDAEGWIKAKDSIQRLAEYCKHHGIKLMIVNYPELHQFRPYPFQRATESVRRAAHDNGAGFLDVYPALKDLKPETLWVSPDDAHPNQIANTRISNSIRDAVLTLADRSNEAHR